MVITQSRSKRKPTGGRYIAGRKKKQYESGKIPFLTRVGDLRSKKERTTGGNSKLRLLSSNIANVADPKTKKFSKATIETVLESPANKQFTRRNIIVKGTVIQTNKGKAKVTSRPGQDGVINAVLVTE